MGLVLYALQNRVSFYVLAVVMVIAGAAAAYVAPKDVLPNVDIPVVVVVWTYSGLNTTDMTSRITTYSEFSLSNNVNSIKRMESQTLPGVAVERIYFDPGVSIDLAIAQVVSATNSVRSVMPPGVQPPIVMRFSASAVPVIQLALSSESESVSKIYDYGQYRIRQTLVQAPGSTLPPPYGGAPRQIMVDLNVNALQAHGLTPLDVTAAMSAQNLVVPSGLSKIGEQQYPVRLNASPETVEALNQIPIKTVNGSPILVRDVANVRDGAPPQVNIVRADGSHSVLISILKNGAASTLSVVNAVKGFLPGITAAAPKDMTIKPLFDQSVFVTGAISDVVREAVIAAGLTGAMILLFLGSWRSTLVVLVSIPLSILTSLGILVALGETINIMTLGGLALAVGILVDDATVAIENTYRLLEEGESFKQAVVRGSAGIAKPAMISTLAICSAFVSVFFLDGAPKFLFTPQALAVIFAMLASYLLSRTLVPILIDLMVAKEHEWRHRTDPAHARQPNVFAQFQVAFERGFSKFHGGYVGLLKAAIRRPATTVAMTLGVLVLGGSLLPLLGRDYFPQVDAGGMTLHIRTRPGQRIEATEKTFAAVETVVRTIVPSEQIALILDNIGLPSTNYNFAFGDGSFVGYNDGQMLISLKPGHQPTADFMRKLRLELPRQFPDTIFYFQPSDMITQILDFGTIAPIDIQVSGRNKAKDLEVAQSIARRLREVKGAVDVHLHQVVHTPEFFVDVDRRLASEIGLTEQQIASAMNVSLGGSFQVNPNFWSDPKTGIPYQLWVQTPEYRNGTMTDLQNTPLFVQAGLADAEAVPARTLSNVATLRRTAEQTVVTHVNTQPTYDVLASVQDRDLAAVQADIGTIVKEEQAKLPAPDVIRVRGQIESMESAFSHIEIGLALAVIAVYLLMAVNFQSWADPAVVLCALPIAFCGIVLSLYVTGTSLSIPSLFGAIMSVGVASANSILLVTFAREHREATGCSAVEAAIAAGETRLRPVLMTATAMFVGLIPMAIGTGEGSEQNAALARAVLGGVAFGTVGTLLLVPVLYSVLRRGRFLPALPYI